VQERGCFVFAFSGPQEVRELELGTDMASVNNLLGFLEKVRPAPGREWFKDISLLQQASQEINAKVSITDFTQCLCKRHIVREAL
jgi:hypothetical protein